MKPRAISNTLAVVIMVVLVVASVVGTYFAVPAAPAPGVTRTVTSTVTAPGAERTVTSTVTAAERTITNTVTRTTTRTATVVAPGELKEGVVKIGHLQGITGGIAFHGIPAVAAARLAVDEINAAGGFVVGDTRYTIDYIHYDAWPPPEAVTLLKRLVEEDGVKVILDGGLSTANWLVKPILTEQYPDVLVLAVCGCGDPFLADTIPNLYRISFDWRDYETMQLDHIIESGGRSVLGIGLKGHRDFEWSVTSEWPRRLEPLGIRLLGVEWIDIGTMDFLPILQRYAAEEPDFVTTHIFLSHVMVLYRQAQELGMTPHTQFIGHDQSDLAMAMATETPLDQLNGWHTYGPVPAFIQAHWDAKALEFARKFKAETGNIPFWWAQQGYEGVYVVVRAMQKAGTVDDTAKIATAMRGLKVTDVPELITMFEPQGPEGLLFGYLEPGQARPNLVLWRWEGGNTIFIRSILPVPLGENTPLYDPTMFE